MGGELEVRGWEGSWDEGVGGELEVGLFTSRICGHIPSATNVFNCSRLLQQCVV